VFLGKTLNAISHLGAKQSSRCGGPAGRKTCKQNSFCVGVATDTSIQHLVQAKKNASSDFVSKFSKTQFYDLGFFYIIITKIFLQESARIFQKQTELSTIARKASDLDPNARLNA